MPPEERRDVSLVDAAHHVVRGTHSYRLLRKLGEGGQGAVYEAEDLDRGKRVAVKLLRNMSPSTIARFKREFRIRERITHPCLVEFGELAVHEGQRFFTMTLISGQSAEGGEQRDFVKSALWQQRSHC